MDLKDIKQTKHRKQWSEIRDMEQDDEYFEVV